MRNELDCLTYSTCTFVLESNDPVRAEDGDEISILMSTISMRGHTLFETNCEGNSAHKKASLKIELPQL